MITHDFGTKYSSPLQIYYHFSFHVKIRKFVGGKQQRFLQWTGVSSTHSLKKITGEVLYYHL